MDLIDLHIHSTASDGSVPAPQILDMALELGLKAIAITDHDTLAGCRLIVAQGVPSEIKFLTGVEISAAYPDGFPGAGSLHLLGYGIRMDDPELNQMLDFLSTARINRNPGIIARLNQLGFAITLEEVETAFEDALLGRPHIARIMKKKGFVKSTDEAFDNYLGKNKPAYVEKKRSGCLQTITTIRKAGGIPILAHPGLIKLEDMQALPKLIKILVKMGLMGIEVYYPNHTPEQITSYEQVAQHYNLLCTGGSDFHGELIPDIKLGRGHGNLEVPFELYEKLIIRLA